MLRATGCPALAPFPAPASAGLGDQPAASSAGALALCLPPTPAAAPRPFPFAGLWVRVPCGTAPPATPPHGAPNGVRCPGKDPPSLHSLNPRQRVWATSLRINSQAIRRRFTPQHLPSNVLGRSHSTHHVICRSMVFARSAVPTFRVLRSALSVH